MNKPWKYKGHDKDVVKELAEQLEAIWKKKKSALGLSQEEVATRMRAKIGSSNKGVTQPVVNQWLKGTTPIPEARLVELMDMLEVTDDERQHLTQIAQRQGRPDYDVSQVMHQLTPQTEKTSDSEPQLLDPKFQAVFEMGVLMGITKQGWTYECIQNALDGGYTTEELQDAIRDKVFVAKGTFKKPKE